MRLLRNALAMERSYSSSENSFMLFINVFLPLRVISHSFLLIHMREGVAVVLNAKEDTVSLDLRWEEDHVRI